MLWRPQRSKSKFPLQPKSQGGYKPNKYTPVCNQVRLDPAREHIIVKANVELQRKLDAYDARQERGTQQVQTGTIAASDIAKVEIDEELLTFLRSRPYLSYDVVISTAFVHYQPKGHVSTRHNASDVTAAAKDLGLID